MNKPLYYRYLGQIKELPFTPKIDKNLLKTLKRIAKFYGCSLRIFNNENTPYYNSEGLYIYFSIKGLNTISKIRLFCHELGHHIQFLNDGDKYYDNNNLADCLRLEWEAESIAYYLMKKYFPKVSLHHKRFNWCRNRKDMDFLREYYGL